jgi:exopolysaccharide biosynthesis polyprenyl glycosylphosphotransferase
MVGGTIRRRRRDRNLTLSAVAELTGLNVGYLSQVENDKASPSLETLSALADAMDVPIAWFLLEQSVGEQPVHAPGGQVVAKFTFDIVMSGLLLLFLSPLLLGISIAVRLTSPGPVLYRQRRIGLRGKPFTMLKFRTMRTGTDRDVDALRAAHRVDDVMFKLRDDPRITGVGRWLRRFSLDELPQLFNVIKGDMSLVGPRPPLPEEVARYEDWHFDRLEVPPGITGLWQISGRADLTFDECVQLDVFYIENWSLTYELFILGKTIPVLLSQRGAY